MLGHPAYWEFISVTESRILVIPTSVIKEFILRDVDTYRKLVNLQSSAWEYGMKFFYLCSAKGSKNAYAYFLMENSIDNIFPYVKHERLFQMLNISRASLYLIEKDFLDRGIIKKLPKKIVILKPELLKAYYDEYFKI